MEPYGLVFTKIVARSKGALPVWYVEADSPQMRAIDRLRHEAWKMEDDWAEHPGAQVFPFIETMGTGAGWQKEFWWEREWRHVGDYRFDRHGELALVVAPEEHHELLRSKYPGVRARIDADWSLERVIASLLGLDPSTVTPFTV